MATINISNLPPAGSEFFVDSESFLDTLSDDELLSIQGGAAPTPVTTTVIASTTPCIGTVVVIGVTTYILHKEGAF